MMTSKLRQKSRMSKYALKKMSTFRRQTQAPPFIFPKVEAGADLLLPEKLRSLLLSFVHVSRQNVIHHGRAPLLLLLPRKGSLCFVIWPLSTIPPPAITPPTLPRKRRTSTNLFEQNFVK